MKCLVKLALAGLSLGMSLTVAHAYNTGDIEAGRARSAACAGCHGPEGKSINPQWPNLAAQVPGYIAKQLADFKSGVRPNPIMAGQAATLSEQDMANLDAFYSSLKPSIAATTEKKLTKQGEKIFRGGNSKTGVSACMSCHGPSGNGIPPRFPRVAGQNSAYAQAQLMAFKSAKRSKNEQVMSRIAFRMSEQEIEAVAQYMQYLDVK
ncbi:MAG: cytochrome c4 [Gammaproteobacteria bacterium]|nr:cytochrome c4 [Gammaproteobacteria bacterium]